MRALTLVSIIFFAASVEHADARIARWIIPEAISNNLWSKYKTKSVAIYDFPINPQKPRSIIYPLYIVGSYNNRASGHPGGSSSSYDLSWQKNRAGGLQINPIERFVREMFVNFEVSRKFVNKSGVFTGIFYLDKRNKWPFGDCERDEPSSSRGDGCALALNENPHLNKSGDSQDTRENINDIQSGAIPAPSARRWIGWASLAVAGISYLGGMFLSAASRFHKNALGWLAFLGYVGGSIALFFSLNILSAL